MRVILGCQWLCPWLSSNQLYCDFPYNIMSTNLPFLDTVLVSLIKIGHHHHRRRHRHHCMVIIMGQTYHPLSVWQIPQHVVSISACFVHFLCPMVPFQFPSCLLISVGMDGSDILSQKFVTHQTPLPVATEIAMFACQCQCNIPHCVTE